MSIGVSRLSGVIQITGLDTTAQGLTTVAQKFDTAGAASTVAARQINEFGGVAKQVLGGLGIATGIAAATAATVALGKESADLAIRAETIGRAYQSATQRAGLSADDLRQKLQAASRGTVTDTELMASSNKALALGVGQNAQQIADLLAIARQKGKDFGEDTAQAFNDIAVGLGRLSPRILDNLGIILDENKIYKEYAQTLGTTADKLDDQQKRQALVNDLIRSNTDLIKKNADAADDAADKIARSQATIDEAKARIGAALLPGVAGAATIGATFIESLTGGLSARADALNQQLATQATSAEDYVKRFNAAVKQLNPSGRTEAGGASETIGQYLALRQLTAAQVDAIRIGAMSDAQRTEAIQGYRQSHVAIVEATQDTIDYKKSLAALADQLSAAKANYDDYANAVLPGTRAFEDEQSRLAIASSKAELALLDFQQAGGGLSKVLDPIQSQIDDTGESIRILKGQLEQATAAVDAQSRVVADAERAQRDYDDAVHSAEGNLSQQQDRLSALQGVYDNLGRSISDAKRQIDDFRRTPLTGEGALDDKLFALEEQIKRAQLRLDQAKLGGAGKDTIKGLQETIDKLRTQEDAVRLQGDLQFDAQRRALEKQGVPNQEKSYADLSAAIAQSQASLDGMTAAQKQAGQAVAEQQKTVRDAQFDLMDASAVQRDHAAAVQEDKDKLDALKQSQQDISKSYDAAKLKLDALNQSYQDAKEKALAPYKAAVDAASEAEHRLQLQHDLTTGALQHTLDEIKKNQKEMPYDEIVAGIQSWQHEIDILTTKYGDLQTAEKLATDPTAAAPGSNAFPGMHAPFTGQPGSSAYNVQGINSVLAGTPLADQGQFITEMSLKYGIPVEVALAMWKIESGYGTAGAAVPNRNPGNLRASPLAAGTNGGFALFDSWKAGIEGFFKLLSENTFGYKAEIDQYKTGDITALLKLISTYAPKLDNNNPQAYYQSVVAMIRQLLAIITGGSASAGAAGSAGVINNGTMADDPRPSQYGIDTVVAGAHLGDTFDADRGPLGVHAGLDLQVKNGTPVHAPLDLTDLRIGYYADAARRGYYVLGIDPYGREWYFGHMTAVYVKSGGSIAKGGTIGTVGMGHVHVQLKQVPGGPPIDPSAALDSAAASGAGPGAAAADPYLPQGYSVGGPRYGTPISRGGVAGVNAAIGGLLPNLDNLIRAIEGVGTAADDTATGMVNATDDILNHATYQNRDGSDRLAYLNQNGGLNSDTAGWTRTGGPTMGIGGPHFGDPIVTPPNKMQSNDPTQDTIASIAGLPDVTAQALKGVSDLTPGWKDTWQQFGAVQIAEIDGAQRFMFGAEQNILQYVTSAEQRINDLIGKILSIPGIHVSTGPSQRDPGGVNAPGQPGGPPATGGGTTGTRYQYNTIITRDSDRALRLLRQQGF